MSLYDRSSLIQVPSLYKDGTLVSTIPEDRSGDFTVVRGSNLSATRVGEDGYIKKGYENLLLQSNTFDTTWTTSNASLTGGQAGYDGSNDAWLLTRTGTFGQIIQNITNSGVQTFSIYAKAGTLNWIRLTQGSPLAYFNLSGSGAVGTTSSNIDAAIESVGDGWFRCSMTSNTSLTNVKVYLVNGDNDLSGTTGTAYIQDAQVNQGLVAYPYLETTTAPAQGGLLENSPRVDWSNGVPAVLVEPSRTNLLPYSEWIGGWDDVNDATIDGVQSFTLGSTGARIQAGSIGSPSGDFVFYAVFDSTDVGKTIKLSYFDATAGGWNSGSEITIDSNGRAERLISTGSNVIGNVAFYGTSTSQSFTLKYCQFEDGSYPTSYIPTYGTSQTRSNEVISDNFDIPTTATIYNSFYSDTAETVSYTHLTLPTKRIV